MSAALTLKQQAELILVAHVADDMGLCTACHRDRAVLTLAPCPSALWAASTVRAAGSAA